MLLILVKGYKDDRDLLPARNLDGTLCNLADDIYYNPSVVKTIEKALKMHGVTEDDVISISVVPSPINNRDRGSNDYHIFCREPKKPAA